MRKIIALALISLMATGAFAATAAKKAAANTQGNPSFTWELDNAKDVASIYNQNSLEETVQIAVDPAEIGVSSKDPVVVTCNGTKTTLTQSSSVICEIQTGQVATIQIASGSFTHGSSGSYAVIQ